MGMVVNTNIGSLVAQAAANATNKSMDTSMERLSTGKRINTAADDAAGMAISSRLESQSRGLSQAIRNAADGQAMIDTTEGAHAEITNILQRMRELAVQSANDTNVAADRTNLQSEVNQLVAEIDRIATQSTWNGVKVLDGSFTSKQLQIGADSGQTVSFSVDNAQSTAIGSYTLEGTAFADDTTDIAADADTAISGYLGTATVAVSAADSAKDYAVTVNSKTGSTGVTATAVSKAKLGSLSTAGTVTFTLGGDSTAAISATMASTGDLGNLKDAINGKSGVTGITAAFGSSTAEIVLTHAQGEDITFASFTHSGGAGTDTLDVTALDKNGSTADSTAISMDGGGTVAAAHVVGQITLSSIKSFTTANFGTTAEADFFGTSAGSTATLSNVASVDISTISGASSAILAIDGAISKINASRADLGGLSNRLDSTISNLTNIKTNADVSRSNIEDADFAAETSNLAKQQILSQAATSMLAQANQSKQSILALLQG